VLGDIQHTHTFSLMLFECKPRNLWNIS